MHRIASATLRSIRRTTVSAALAFVLLAGLLAGAVGLAPTPALAQDNPGDAAARLAELDAATLALGEEIERARIDLDARRAEYAESKAVADGAADTARAALELADAERVRIDDLVVAAWSGNRTEGLSSVLVAGSPQELIDQMSLLDVVGEESARSLAEAGRAVEEAVVAQEKADVLEATAGEEQAKALAVQEKVVQRRDDLARQTAEADALLERLTAEAEAAEAAAAERAAAAAAASEAEAEAAAQAAPAPISPEQLATSEAARDTRASRAADTRGALFVAPAIGRFTSGFGVRGGSPHNGIDIANTIGTPIVSVADGTVVDAGPASGFGLWVRVQHDDGTVTVYGHNNTNVVSAGQRVSAGQQIATIGNRGYSTGPHVHFEVEPPGGGKANPRSWLAERGVVV